MGSTKKLVRGGAGGQQQWNGYAGHKEYKRTQPKSISTGTNTGTDTLLVIAIIGTTTHRVLSSNRQKSPGWYKFSYADTMPDCGEIQTSQPASKTRLPVLMGPCMVCRPGRVGMTG